MSFREAVELATQIGAVDARPDPLGHVRGEHRVAGTLRSTRRSRTDAELHVVVLRRFVPFAFVRPGG